ncbi:MAG: DUF1700 domain-containing protein [Oscillospiraceae bacterium]|nr:DUF1700 domain-containing protein [Oscillospiraceae bacterium]
MNKSGFLSGLENRLKGLPQEEIKKTTDYYSEMIDDAVENGETEQDVTARLGSVDEVADKIINEMPLGKIVKANVRERNISAAATTLLIVGSPVWFPLSLSVIVVALAVYAAVWSAIIACFAADAALAMSGVAMLVASPFAVTAAPWKAMLLFGLALVCIGAAVIVFYLSIWVAKLFIRLTVYSIRKLKRTLIEGGNHESE